MVALGLVCILVIVELFALAWLYLSVDHYKRFWESKARESGEITYVALGDSAAQGIGASSPMRGYVGLLAKRLELERGESVRIINLSKTGATIRDCITGQIPLLTTVKADVITIEIGANDIASFSDSKFRADFSELLALLPNGAYVSNMPLFNSRPHLGTSAMQASKIIEEELRSYPELRYVDLQRETTEHQNIFGFAPDLFHPNNFSYKNWETAFWLKIQQDSEPVGKSSPIL